MLKNSKVLGIVLDDVLFRLGEVAQVRGKEDVLLQNLVHVVVEGLVLEAVCVVLSLVDAKAQRAIRFALRFVEAIDESAILWLWLELSVVPP